MTLTPKKIASGLVWDTWAEAEAEFNELKRYPTTQPILIEISPEVAKKLLAKTNTSNRELRDAHAIYLANQIDAGNFELTGDTIKFGNNGKLLDGQHRLSAAARSESGIITYAVFGLSPKIFDVLDRGARRTAADSLQLAGYKDPVVLGGAINFVAKYDNYQSETSKGSGAKYGLSPRDHLELIKGQYADLQNWTHLANQIYAVHRFPPALMAGILFLASRDGNERNARKFGEAMLGTDRQGRNQTFDILSRKILSVKQANNGHIQRGLLSALLIIAWNYWNAGLVPTARAMSWKSARQFPQVETDGKSFQTKARNYEDQDSSLSASTGRVLAALAKLTHGRGTVAATQMELAEMARCNARSMAYYLGTLKDAGLISLVGFEGTGAARKSVWAVSNDGRKEAERVLNSFAPDMGAGE